MNDNRLGTEPGGTAIAIVGMGAVFPGAGDAPTFWRNIQAGTDAISDVSPDRWDPELYCDPAQAGPAPFYTRRGGFLGELATFNPGPFGIMPSSVDGTEPDQLLMLRAAAEAIADCGTLPDRERVGVIVGRGGYVTPGLSRMEQRVSVVHQLTAVLSDLLPDLGSDRVAAVRAAFEERLGGGGDPQDSIGLVPNFAASRLANRFDLLGPAYTVDAACASSLIAVDHAVRELTSGRCDAVLAGGVHICHNPALWSVFTQLKVLSPRGVIRPFDASADGTLLSEGAGAVLLKRLDDARAAGDRVYAVIRGVGVSSDGRATSMLNPLVEGQELAIRRAWAAAGLDPLAPDALGLLEAHGTATPTGDRAELTALGRVFGSAPGGRPIGIGTVKSMIGHAMPAAGIAGLIKTAYAVHAGVLPPTLHVDEPHPALAGTRFAPVTQTQPWNDAPLRRAAVSAFGFGGINAHVVLESEPVPARRAATGRTGPDNGARAGSTGEAVLRLAAGSAAELAALLRAPDAGLLARADREPDAASAAGLCRLAIVAPDERKIALARKIAERGTPWRGRSDIWFTPRPLLHGPEQVAFLYPGFEPGFAPRTEGVASAFGLPEPWLHAAAGDGAGPHGAVRHAVDIVAVGRLFSAALRELGITPGVLAGHSLGEWTAMVAGGMYPEIDEFIASVQPGLVELPDVVYLALGAGAGQAAELARGAGGVTLTHDNCTRQSVLCGPAGSIAAVAQRAREAGIMAQVMPFRTGFHSPAYAPHVPSIRRALGGLTVRPAQVPVWSATTVAPFPRNPAEISELVLRHLVEPVRFRQLTLRLHEAGVRAFVQVGPGSLTGFTDDTLAGLDYLTVATATPKRDGLAQLRRVAAALWAEGLSPRFERLTAAPAAGGAAGPAVSARPADRAGAGYLAGSADAAGSIRLRLGTPVIRLTGAVEPLSAGGAREAVLTPDASVPAARQPALAELQALLSETAASAESVVLALTGPRPQFPAAAPAVPAAAAAPAAGPASAAVPAPAAVPAGPRPGSAVRVPDQAGPGSRAAGTGPAVSQRPAGMPPGGETSTEREFSLRTFPEVVDHCLIPQPEGWHDDSDRFPIIPMTALLEIMADAALQLAPDQVVTGFQQVRAMRWLAIAPAARTAVHASWARADGGRPASGQSGSGRVRVTIEGYASGYVLLAARYPAAPPPDHTPLRDPQAPPVSASELYSDRWMFHGPRYAGVASVATLAADGIRGTVLSLPARGALLDSVGQLIGHWMQVQPSDAQTVLPTGIGEIRLFGPQPPHGMPLDCVGRIRELTDTELRASAEIRDPDGLVWCQIEGWTTRRFATDEVILEAKRKPGRTALSVLAPGDGNIAFERWRDTAGRELIMRLYLNAVERAEYERLPAPRQRRWLLGRIAVKDAVRRSLWERGAGEVYPAELTVADTADGVRVLGPFRAPLVTLALSPDVPGRPCAVAVAGLHAGLRVETGPAGTVLVTGPGQEPLTVDTTTGTITAGTVNTGGAGANSQPLEAGKGH